MVSVVCQRRAPRCGAGASLGLGSIAAILLLAQPAAAQLTPFGQPAQPVQLQQAPFQTIPAAPAPGTYQPTPSNYAAAPGAGPSTFSFAAPPPQIGSGDTEAQTVVSAKQALDQFFALQMDSVPPAMLQAAEGIAIFPNMIKGGFIFGVNYGKGVLCVRNPDRSWSPPVMVTMGGGSVGFQAGVQAADIVLVFATPRSLQGILNGQKVTLGADASIAAGPVGRSANAGTDARLGAEIYSYARSRGLFAGVSLGGSDLSVDHNADALLYGRFNVTPSDVFTQRGLAIRPEVQQLVEDLNARSRPQPVAVTTGAALPQQALTPFGAQPQAVNQAPVAVQAAPYQAAPYQPATAQPVPFQPPSLQPASQQPAIVPIQAPPLVPITPR
jgi:lipid-binding SYLF domain-containing protein